MTKKRPISATPKVITRHRKVSATIVPVDQVRQIILLLRGQRVILGADLARLYGVTTTRLNQQVRRNLDRFPEDFMFQLTWEEAVVVRSQIATFNLDEYAQAPDNKGFTTECSSFQFASLNDLKNPHIQQIQEMTPASSRSQTATLDRGRNVKYRPFAFTEHGAIMAATVLNSPNAVKASLFVVRAFVQLRELLSTHRNLAEKLNELERKLQDHDGQILGIIDAIRELMKVPDDPPKPPIGLHTEIARITPSSRRKA